MCKRDFRGKESLKKANSRKLKVSFIYCLFGTYLCLTFAFLSSFIPLMISIFFMLLFFGLSIFLLIKTIYIVFLLYNRKSGKRKNDTKKDL